MFLLLSKCFVHVEVLFFLCLILIPSSKQSLTYSLYQVIPEEENRSVIYIRFLFGQGVLENL